MGNNIIIFIVVYLLLINLIGAITVILDKRKAKKNKWRIQEKTIFIQAILGGTPAIYFTMKKFRHKTKHASFMVGLPVIFILQIAAIFAVWYIFFK